MSWSCIDWVRGRLSAASRVKRRLLVLAVVALLLAAVAPSLHSYTPHVLNLQRRFRGEAPNLIGMSRFTRIIANSARWLRGNSPPLDGRGYSVLGPWGDGHILKYVAAKPVVQDNFGDDVAPENFALAEDYYAALDEGEALEIIAPLRTRYVVVRSSGSGHGGDYLPSSIFSRLYLLRGSRGVIRRGGRESEAVPALKRHRLVFESPPVLPGGERQRSFVKIFERVDGALVEGAAEPGAAVRAKLRVASRDGESFEYRSLAHADESGRYSLRLPYSNERFSSNVMVGDHYLIGSSGQVRELRISEEDVQRGHTIEGPSL
jgi:asparagine N-glycosylation enzyme membrane subunit Stt3